MAHILVVDDDKHIREIARYALQQSGYQITEADDGAHALNSVATHSFDLVVLDINLPEEDGFEVCKKIRKSSALPILFLSSRDSEIDKVLGLELGADDFLPKPFSPRELVARVKAILRRTKTTEPAPNGLELTRGALRLNSEQHRCFWMNQEVQLTATEFAILKSLAQTSDRVYTRDELVDRAYGAGYVITDRTVDSHIRRLRKKFSSVGADLIETVVGVGYRLRA